MQNHTWMHPIWTYMMLDELWCTKECLWVFKGEFLIIFALEMCSKRKICFWNSWGRPKMKCDIYRCPKWNCSVLSIFTLTDCRGLQPRHNKNIVVARLATVVQPRQPTAAERTHLYCWDAAVLRLRHQDRGREGQSLLMQLLTNKYHTISVSVWVKRMHPNA